MIESVYSPSPARYESMEYRRCGQSGVRLPVLALGLWRNFGSGTPFQEIKSIAHYAFDNGICHFDLANNYGPVYGSAEENFGRLIDSSFRHYRDELLISTKAGFDMWPGPYGNWGSRKYLMASLDQSLRRMKLDYVDIFYTHRWDPETPLEETMQALVDIVRQGKALYVGLSRYPLEEAGQACRYLNEHDVPCLLYQDRYNILDRGPERKGLLELCSESGTGFISYSPLHQGLLSSRYLDGIPGDSRMAHGGTSLLKELLTPENLQVLKELNNLALQRGQSLAQMSLAWLLQDRRVSSVIIGASSTGQIADNLRCMAATSFSEVECRQIDILSSSFNPK